MSGNVQDTDGSFASLRVISAVHLRSHHQRDIWHIEGPVKWRFETIWLKETQNGPKAFPLRCFLLNFGVDPLKKSPPKWRWQNTRYLVDGNCVHEETRIFCKSDKGWSKTTIDTVCMLLHYPTLVKMPIELRLWDGYEVMCDNNTRELLRIRFQRQVLLPAGVESSSFTVFDVNFDTQD